jgi:hypothetical protein
MTNNELNINKKSKVTNDRKLAFKTELTCYICKKKSHILPNYSNKKKVKTIKVRNQNSKKNNKKLNKYECIKFNQSFLFN